MNQAKTSLALPFPVTPSVVAVIGVLVYVATAMVSPLNGEDFALTRDMTGIAPAERFAWMFAHSLNQISQWNARLGEQLAIFWLGVPRIYFVLASTLALLCYVVLVAIWARKQGDRSSFIGVVSYSLAFIWLFWPSYEVFFWTTAHAAYFQPMLLVLLLLSFYRTPEAQKRLNESNVHCLTAIALAALVGVSFENVPPAVLASVGLVLLINGRSSWRLRALIPMLVLLIAWVVLMLAPSTGIRRAAYAQMYPVVADLDHYVSRAQSVVTALLRTSGLLLSAAAVASVYLWRLHGWKQQVVLAWSVSILTVGTVVAAPYTEPRAFIVPWALWFLLIMAAVVRLAPRPQVRYALAALAVASLWFPFQANFAYVEFARSLQERDSYIRVIGRTERCASGINVGHNPKTYPYKYLNSREQWYVANPGFVSSYYRCTVRIQ